jgi:hypothetical protein
MSEFDKLAIALEKAKMNLYDYYAVKYKDLIDIEKQNVPSETYVNIFGKGVWFNKTINIAVGAEYESFNINHKGDIVFVHTYLTGPVHSANKELNKGGE